MSERKPSLQPTPVAPREAPSRRLWRMAWSRAVASARTMFVALKHADCVDQRADLPIDSLAPGGMGDLWGEEIAASLARCFRSPCRNSSRVKPSSKVIRARDRAIQETQNKRSSSRLTILPARQCSLGF
jgi:hypothetical protein